MLTFFGKDMVNHVEEVTDRDLDPVFLAHLPLERRGELFSELN